MPPYGSPAQPSRSTGPSRHRRGRGRLPVLGSLVFAAVLAAIAALFAPVSRADAAPALEPVANFGANPGALNMYVYKPASLPDNAPVVVALHGCKQNAQIYADNAGLTKFADRNQFMLVFAEQTQSNNWDKCFNWFQPTDNKRGQGEAASIRQMVAHADQSLGADGSRAYVTGLSAGGVMTSVMLSTYPEVFKAGAVVAGIPYGCTDGNSPFTCMNPGVDGTPEEWAKRVRDAHPGYQGPWPRMAIWAADNDTKVVPKNADELRDQWTALHGLDQEPDKSDTLPPNDTRRDQYLAQDGSVAVEVNKVPVIGHGLPVDPGSGEQQCGTATTYFFDSICSSYWITGFFGLSEGSPGPDPTPTPSQSTTPPAAACFTANNYEQVKAGRATTSGGYVYAKGSEQEMGLYNTATTHTLKESPTGYFTISDDRCP
ncbi:extracellular catalytic domain type 1 short-chain-length polyhydroxyalkanoate depolymerase [Streptomyces luteolus]|uniref:PHB depolymerase family esterase n=1 Tax=Streptomyces luteolus TaxID=3043615 RepID=A0ABT6T9P7_9ACTN|nr:PHB depolymerase family esterase [Streptomyces sp. B-S-A12]MDI3423612.1 PHB depolymerase family esterase [Streptomyces sp. B-S-A12]